MPLAPQRYGVQFTVDQEAHELLEEAYRLLGPGVVSHGDVKAVFCRALRVLLPLLRKQKYAATDKPRAAQPRSEDSRYVPAEVRREVWRRDRGQCTYVSPDGKRCEERSGLEYDHIDAYGKDGSSKTAANIRLRCRAHNLLEAERVYGAAFMEAKLVRRREDERRLEGRHAGGDHREAPVADLSHGAGGQRR